MPPRLQDITNQRFERLVARKIDRRVGAKTYWFCDCDCGVVVSVPIANLRNGHTRSCGCLMKETSGEHVKALNTTHGKSGSPEYIVWLGIRARCEDPKSPRFARYGGRGIKRCERWKKFENFFSDMGSRPTGYQIERKDNDGDYEPNNCLWIPRKQQQRNTSRTRLITFNGETLTLSEWARKTGMDHRIIQQRLDKYKWTLERALTTHV